MFLDFLSWRNPAEKFTIYSSYETENIIGKGEKTIMKMKKVTAMGMAVLMAATMIQYKIVFQSIFISITSF